MSLNQTFMFRILEIISEFKRNLMFSSPDSETKVPKDIIFAENNLLWVDACVTLTPLTGIRSNIVVHLSTGKKKHGLEVVVLWHVNRKY